MGGRSSLLNWLSAFGLDAAKTRDGLRNIGATRREYRAFLEQNAALGNPWPVRMDSPHFQDRWDAGGTASGHYFHQDLLVARRIYERQPERHVDVGSRIDGFVAHVAVFREIEVFDIRPVEADVPNIRFVRQDIMDASTVPADHCDSLSCLHALEHFGLGRYGDPIDAAGHEKGFASLTKMLRAGGMLYLSVPVGRERVEFNGQRVFSIERVEQMYQAAFSLAAFSYVDDAGKLHEDADTADAASLEYGCGIFELKKKG